LVMLYQAGWVWFRTNRWTQSLDNKKATFADWKWLFSLCWLPCL